MNRRLYFLLPDLASAIRTANDLLAAGIGYGQMHFLGRRSQSLGGLHEASFMQKSDVRRALFLGAGLGVIGGMVLGVYLRLTPIGDHAFGLGTLLLCMLGGALFGGWSASLVGVSTPNRKLRPFDADIEAGKILLMLDVPASRAGEIGVLIGRLHPEAEDRSGEVEG